MGARDGAPLGVRGGGPEDAGAMARALGDWHRELPQRPRHHTRNADPWFVRGLATTRMVRVGFAGGPGSSIDRGFLARRVCEEDALCRPPGARRGRGLGRAVLDTARAEGGLTPWTCQANRGARSYSTGESVREAARTDGAGNDERLPDVRLEWAR